MRIREMFPANKPIDRDIKGVIKVGQADDENIKQELEEYVVTKELSRRFTEFFENYVRSFSENTDKMGVWITGFFGSGKSHFLKILSYLLENKEVGGKRAIDYFIEDKKIIDPMVLANMKKCADMSATTDVMLFNIDSKSGQSGAQSKDAIVSVLLKVFNEMQGFYGSRPYLADLERDLTNTGRYEEFKQKYQESFCATWEESRHRFKFIQDKIVKTLSDLDIMSESAARTWCDKAMGTYDISIESFANMVSEYINKKGKNHRVVFLVDEIGQYIGDDSKLMLNLQTVTEDLGTACGGRAWIIVTSQQDIDAIAKDMGLRSNDFSKIQGRFNTRLTLSSANVDEVIKKRILEKNETAAQTLRLLYGQNETIMKNLIVFNDGVEKKLPSSDIEFTEVYPFMPYQFNLLGGVLSSIRKHGASGKHLSEGERSMLALFQESVIKKMDNEVGAIIPFNVFYDALHRFLDHSHAGVIIKALENERINPDKAEICFNVEVLKTLFMIKYVDDIIVANVDNLVSILVDSLDTDRIELKAKVEEALKVLTGQKLVQKNGDIYVFLTDEEQEINREIDGQNVEMAEITAEVSNIIFEDIYSDKRYRYPAHSGRYTFAFNQFVDNHPHRANQGNDIGMRVLTPNSEHKDETTLRMMSGHGHEVLVVLPNDRAFFDELRSSMKIRKYLSGASSGVLTKYEQIKAGKSEEARQRLADAKLFLREAMTNADIYVNGDKAAIGAKEITGRLSDAMGKLVASVYHKLSYIEAAYGEAHIRQLFSNSNQQAFALEEKQMNEHALYDLSAVIKQNTQAHTKTSMKTLKDRFLKEPYGFIEDDVEWIVAKLFTDGVISFTVSGAAVTLINKSAEDIIRFITKREYVEKLLCESRERANEQQKKAARELMRELFGTAGISDEDDAIMQKFQEFTDSLLHTIKEYEIMGQNKPYPGKSALATGRSILRKIMHFEHTTEFFSEVVSEKNSYLDFADDFKPIKEFYDGEQKKIFDNALDKMRIYEESKNFLVDEEVEKYVAAISSILKMSSPYSNIHKLPELIRKYTGAYMSVLNIMAPPIYESIEDAKKRVLDGLENKSYKNELSGGYNEFFRALKNKAECCNNIATFQNIKVEADALKLRLLNEISKRDEKEIEKKYPPPPSDDLKVEEPPQPPKLTVKNISIRSINTGGTWRIESKTELDARINELREKLHKQLEDNTILNIEF